MWAYGPRSAAQLARKRGIIRLLWHHVGIRPSVSLMQILVDLASTWLLAVASVLSVHLSSCNISLQHTEIVILDRQLPARNRLPDLLDDRLTSKECYAVGSSLLNGGTE